MTDKPDWQRRAEELRRERWTRLVSRETRRRILNRDYPPRLEWPDPCPVDAGDEIELHRDVTVIVARPRPIDKQDHSQGWRTSYTVRDLRAEFLLRRVPPARPPRRDELDADGYVPPPGPATAAKTRIESHYTSSSAQAVPESEEGIDPDWHDRGKEQRELTRIESRKKIEVERDLQAAKSRLNRLLRGLDAPAQKVMLAEISRLCDEAERAQPEALKDAA